MTKGLDMPSLSFDPVAHLYDATRGHPDAVAQQIARAMEQSVEATPELLINTTITPRFLEIGIGTGRIAFPLASLSHNYTGIDISEKMLEQLEAKILSVGWEEVLLPWGSDTDEDVRRTVQVHRFVQHPHGMQPPPASMRLVRADMTSLPFLDASFDVVVAVHVFHLVDGWEQAVQEALRVLRPGGSLLHCWDEYEKLNDGPNIAEEWGKIVRQLGVSVGRPGAGSVQRVTEWLKQHGYQTERIQAVTWQRTVSPREALERITQRLWSSTWSVPDDIFAQSVERLNAWVATYYGSNLDKEYQQECKFVINKTKK